MRYLALLAFAVSLQAQSTAWKSTSSDVSLSGAGTTVTIQKPANPANTQILIERIAVYCSVACSVTQAAKGTAATATAGTGAVELQILASVLP